MKGTFHLIETQDFVNMLRIHPIHPSRRPRVRGLLCAILAASIALPCWSVASSQEPADPLAKGFADPPNSAKPRVWWHWMNGNITPEGIKLDLEWMHRVGIGGFTVFEGAIHTPQVVPQRLIYMTPEWKDAFRLAIGTAQDFHMEVTIASSPGWSETGGPWVSPSHAMKKMVWSETQVDGGKIFRGTLPRPPEVAGLFQNSTAHFETNATDIRPPDSFNYYADSAVVAYRIPPDDKPQIELKAKITSSDGVLHAERLSDGDVDTTALDLPSPNAGQQSWVQFEFAQPQTVQSVTLATKHDLIRMFDFDNSKQPHPYVEASNDGVRFQHIADVSSSSITERTISFSAVTAKFFRICFPAMAELPRSHARPHIDITELTLSPASRVNEFEKRAGYATVQNYYNLATPPATPGSIVAPSEVIDLTSHMNPDGQLKWNVPPGRWAILRIGYSLTGHQNGPAPPEATGLEVDKLNRQFVKNYLDRYLSSYEKTVGPNQMGAAGITHLLTDSAEIGCQNWTDDILAEFMKRRGYDPKSWLPVLTGVIVGSPEKSDQFLWDFRRTVAELFAQNHYGEIAEDLHSHGMGYYGEALEYHRPSLGDDMEMRQHDDIPMGAMWTFQPSQGPNPDYVADLRGAASIAHIYGQNLVGAESMTATVPAWGWSPAALKPIADLELASGVNLFMIHESTHQPLIGKAPGLSLGEFGLWFNRNETWAEQAGPWITYLARSSYLLQQGHFDADVAYFYGEESPLTALYGLSPQLDAPRGYGFDFVNADVILHQFSLHDDRLQTPGGTAYRILYLGGTSKRMTLPVLLRIRELVMQGAVVVGDKPTDSPSLADDPIAFRKVADELWGTGKMQNMRSVGKGKVYSGMSANAVLANLQLQQDFSYTRPEADTELMFVHRKLADGDLYFVDNRRGRPEDLDVTLRVTGKAPELWHADSGRTEFVSYRSAGGVTTIPLHLDANESTFIVFRKPAAVSERSVPRTEEARLTVLKGPWSVTFQPGRGVDAPATFDKLISWTDSSNEGIKYFSGTATYETTLSVSSDWLASNNELWLDLGEVKELADISVNGVLVGTAWKPPYRVSLGKSMKPGPNDIKIKVSNLWANRIIGDQQQGAKVKYAFTTFEPYTADSPLFPSGLLGPVVLYAKQVLKK